jgi:beta-N-acetylhexosaminidase
MSVTARDRWIDDRLGAMDLDQLVGQVFVLGMCGPVITPDVRELIQRRHVGGLRVTTKFRGLTLTSDLPAGSRLPGFKERSYVPPAGLARDYAMHQTPVACTPVQYAATIAELRRMSRDRRGGVPLHAACDQEGNAVDDIVNGVRLFPHPLAYAVADDPALTERCWAALGRQIHAQGIDLIHAPVLDINTNPANPEVGTRAFGDTAELVLRHARAAFRGLTGAGVTATGKHFPGRGASAADAHHGLPTVEASAAELRQVHLAPFRQLIADGLRVMMVAHSLYPALGITDRPASASPRALQEILRGELGFTGVIETDNMMMGGILQTWDVRQAAVEVLAAGCDLVLLRDELPTRHQVLDAVRDAVRSGALPEARLLDAVRRVLGMRWDMGLADPGRDCPAAAEAPIADPACAAAAAEIAQRSVLCLRDRGGLLPVRPEARILLIEQIFPTHLHANNLTSHPGMLWSCLDAALPGRVACVEVPYQPGEADLARVRRRLAEEPHDLVVATSWYYHKDGAAGGGALRAALAGRAPVVVIANTPYRFADPPEAGTVLVSFHPGSRDHLDAIAAVIAGRLAPATTCPVRIA